MLVQISVLCYVLIFSSMWFVDLFWHGSANLGRSACDFKCTYAKFRIKLLTIESGWIVTCLFATAENCSCQIILFIGLFIPVLIVNSFICSMFFLPVYHGPKWVQELFYCYLLSLCMRIQTRGDSITIIVWTWVGFAMLGCIACLLVAHTADCTNCAHKYFHKSKKSPRVK